MRLAVLTLLLVSCSDTVDPLATLDAQSRSLLGPDQASDQYIPILEWSVQDAEVVVDAACCGVPCHCGEEYERRQRCWQTHLFYCTPTGAPPGDDPAVYQQAVVMDICNEDGVPCEPAAAGDENCQWEIIDLGDCEGFLECDPTREDPYINRNVACLGETPDGQVINGRQDFICNKGSIVAGPCVPCEVETCDGEDNDCDGNTDEGQYPCMSECGEGTAVCHDGELINCDAQTPVNEDCDAEDNDCDEAVDEQLFRPCETLCEVGVEVCAAGAWGGCTARQPIEEACNGTDDDCDGLSDEGIHCACPPEMIGFLLPCMEDPLTCGQGFKTCECADEDCNTTQMTSCLAMCEWLPEPGVDCDPTLGTPVEEICNNFDDDCDRAIDEDLVAGCYTGPDGTVNVGVCRPGELQCHQGVWGNEFEGAFIQDLCLGEVTPIAEDLCTGNDDNCDGVIDKVMEDTDVLFVVDTSGSMSPVISAVQRAMTMFSANYSDQEVIQWGLVIGPVDANGEDHLHMATNLVPFQQFMPVLVSIDDLNTSEEMLYDAVYLSIRNLQFIRPLHEPQYEWRIGISSAPTVGNWALNWRQETNHVIIVFSDEEGQSYLLPEVAQDTIINAARDSDDLAIYTFSTNSDRNGDQGWEPISVNGGWSPLTGNANRMFDRLMDILDETACGGGGNNQGAAYTAPGRFFYAAHVAKMNLYEIPKSLDQSWLHTQTRQCIHPFELSLYIPYR